MMLNLFIVEFILTMTANYSNPSLVERIDQCLSDEGNLSIKLNSQKLTDQDMKIIVEHAIQMKQCTSLELNDNEITSEGMSVLASELKKNSKLLALYLHGNPLADTGIYSFAQVLTTENQTLEVLDLSSIGLTDVGAEDLAAMLQKNQALTRLQLQSNAIGDRGAQHLAEVLTKDNRTLLQLEMAENKFVTDTCVDFLVEMIKCNRSLKLFDIRLCSISDSGKAKLRETSESNKELQLLL